MRQQSWVILSLALSAPALADDSADLLEGVSNLEELSLEDLLNLKTGVGSFLDLDVHATPVSLTVVDREQIRLSGARHLGELLEIYVPGFQYMYNKWNGDLWGMRGIATDRNTKIIFLVNGVKLNHESRDGAYSEMNLGLLGDIQRIEVLRGPAGLMYGSGAIAGVVNVVTRRPEATTGDVAAGYGTTDGVSVQAFSHAQRNVDESVTVSAGFRRSDGLGDRGSKIYGNNSWPTDGVPSPNGELADGAAWATPGNFRGSVEYRYRNVSVWARATRQVHPAGPFFIVDPFPGILGNPPDGTPPAKVGGDEVAWDDPLANTESWATNRRLHIVENVTVAAEGSHPFGQDQLDVDAAVIGVTNRIAADFREGYNAAGAKPAGTIDQTMGERRYLLNVQLRIGRVPNLQSAIGAQYRLDHLGPDLQGLNMHETFETHPNISEVIYHNVAAYTENAYTIGTVTLFGGARYDLHSRTDGVLSPKAAVVWAPNDQNSLKLLFQSAANNGSADNYEFNWRHYDDDGNVRDEPYLERPQDPEGNRVNATTEEALHSLRPERVSSLELSTVHDVARKLAIMPSVSYNRVSNLFAWNQDLFRVVNAGQYDFLAAEAELRYHSDPVRAGLSHAWQRPVAPDLSGVPFEVPVTELVDNGDGTFSLRETGETQRIEVTSVSDAITRDGRHFLNLATHATKLYADVQVTPALRLHASSRVFWGLAGRREIYEADEKNGENYLGVATSPIVKLNAAMSIALPADFDLFVYGYDLLGTIDNRHAVRWQQMATPEQMELYTVDQRAFGARLEKAF